MSLTRPQSVLPPKIHSSPSGVIADAKVGDTRSQGVLLPASSDARSWAEVAGDGTQPACVLNYVTNCVVKATVIRSEARSRATAAGSVSTDTGTRLVDLRVLGIPISGTPRPNTTLVLPGIGFIILNEQVCDNGGLAVNGTCSGAVHSGITVRAVRIVITLANNLLGLAAGPLVTGILADRIGLENAMKIVPMVAVGALVALILGRRAYPASLAKVRAAAVTR